MRRLGTYAIGWREAMMERVIGTMLDDSVWDNLDFLPVDALVDLIDTYLSTSHALLADIRQAAERGDCGRLYYLLHELKGSSATLGVRNLAELCHSLDHDIRRHAAIEPARWLPRLEAEYAHGAQALAERRMSLLLRGGT